MVQTKFQASEQSGSEEDFLNIFYLFLSWGQLGPCGLDLNKFSKRPLSNATYQVLST